MRLPSADLEETTSRVLERGGAALHGASILLTGGTGFVGRWLIETFCALNATAKLGATIHILTRNVQRFRSSAPHLASDSAVRMIEGDLRALDVVADVPSRFDFVIHGATESSAALAANPQLVPDVIGATGNVLELAVRARARRFLYLSSGAVYGAQPRDLSHIAETFCGAPDVFNAASAYGETKRAGELLCASYATRFGIEAVVARGFSFIGPHLPLDLNFAAGNFIRDALDGNRVEIRGDGTPLRSYMYAADLAVWLWVMLLHGAAGRAYNVGSETAVSIAELAREASHLPDVPLTASILGTPDPEKKPERYIPSTARAREELGLDERTDWRTALRKTYDWHRALRADLTESVR